MCPGAQPGLGKKKINKLWVAASQADTQVTGGLGKVRQGGQLAWEKK